jgi:hypothetical protein
MYNRPIGTQLKDAMLRAASGTNGQWLSDIIRMPRHLKKQQQMALKSPSKLVISAK